jgi:hypothetical protein
VKKFLAAVTTTGALTLAALGGTVATASAASLINGPVGYFAGSSTCVSWVQGQQKVGYYDCQYVQGPNGGWYAILGKSGGAGPYTTSGICVNHVPDNYLGVWDCEHVSGKYPGWYIFTPGVTLGI